jgi:hypothetical protein
MTMTEVNLVVIINVVGFFVCRRTHPGNVQSLVSTYWRMERSINRQINRDIKRTRPNTSIRSAFLRKMLLTIAGSFRKLKFFSMPIHICAIVVLNGANSPIRLIQKTLVQPGPAGWLWAGETLW